MWLFRVKDFSTFFFLMEDLFFAENIFGRRPNFCGDKCLFYVFIGTEKICGIWCDGFNQIAQWTKDSKMYENKFIISVTNR